MDYRRSQTETEQEAPGAAAPDGARPSRADPAHASFAVTAAPLLVSQDEAARQLGVERTTIWRMCCRGDLDRVHIGRRSLVTRASIEAYIASQLQRI